MHLLRITDPGARASRRNLILSIVLAAFVVPLLFASAGDGEWLKRVPEKDRARPNPMASDPQAARAGAKLFRDHCAKCHGEDARGRGKRPSLRSERVRHATAGELEWLLNNGSLRNGMPSWSSLPEPERWQLVTYVKTLP